MARPLAIEDAAPQPDFWRVKPAPAEKPHYAGHRQRLRERAAAGGLAALPDYEVLELFLFRSIPQGDVKPLAKQLLARFGSLGGVLGATAEELRTVKGVGDALALDLRLLHEASLRTAKEQVARRPVISSWNALLAYVKAAMAHEGREQFRVLFLDKRNSLIADEVMGHGTVDHAPVYPREVVRRALELSASAIILVHNHPSGDPTPSQADIEMTRQVIEAGRSLRIAIHDHLVVGRDGVASFKALGLL
ncbi:DNA repair protein RadC [Phenylobacterium sp.]|uniref:RadC family protein n=1 Tax=Phenylobacterium sp. TaxID=1871053 RepID=UPI0025D31FE4|nr:DNA repair protein RadC [Phenylobacterium sp.]MBX3485050.1 DNA repair protein RadC [Phenylobacterium sp.]MCW5760201.1 DNA repair protein RadC [Phenylobacterium sp.]